MVRLKLIGNLLDFRLIKISDHTLVTYFSKDIAISSERELMENKICSIMQKAKGNFYFVQEGKDRLGLHLDIPENEADPIEYSKNFLEHLI